ncbi:MAG: permease [Candidatus Brocadiia bacterium]
MNWKEEWKPFAWISGLFLAIFFLPIAEQPESAPRFNNAVVEALQLARWYAREHVLLCLVPAFFIAGAISVFVSQASVMKYLGARANKVVAYGVASVSGTILAVCSCTVLPLFAGIYKMGAGLGPACAFLYSGPAISVLAIVLSARILGIQLGSARGIGAIAFSLVIGLAMHFIFRHEEMAKAEAQAMLPVPTVTRPLWQNGLFFLSMVGILVFANWGKTDQQEGLWHAIYAAKWWITSIFAVGLAFALTRWLGIPMRKMLLASAPVILLAVAWPFFPEAIAARVDEYKALLLFTLGALGLGVVAATTEGEAADWFGASWTLAKQIMPLLLGGVLLSGLLLGRPGHEGWIPSEFVAGAVGGNSLFANFVAAVLGAFMYFATLTEVPIVQGLISSGMGQGPALTLLLAGPALSLPSMLVIASIMGVKKTVVFVSLVIVLSTVVGWFYGAVIA